MHNLKNLRKDLKNFKRKMKERNVDFITEEFLTENWDYIINTLEYF